MILPSAAFLRELIDLAVGCPAQTPVGAAPNGRDSRALRPLSIQRVDLRLRVLGVLGQVVERRRRRFGLLEIAKLRVEEGELVMSSLVSTGTAEVPETTTPVGYHSVLAKFDAQTMEGTISGDYYRVEDVPYVMYFDNLGNAIHGTYWHNNFGTPMSHGCVNMPTAEAEWAYNWSTYGTQVTVQN